MSILSFVGERPDDATKTFDWKGLLRHHPASSCLAEAETDALLRGEASRERVYAAGSLIVRQGEAGDVVFLIGSGAAQVQLDVDGTRVTLCALRKADVFGEVALLEGSSRMATVSAVQECLLLEIRGDVFRELLAPHPNLERLIPLDDRTLFDLVSRVEQAMPASPSTCGAHPLPDCSRRDYRLLLARILRHEAAPRTRLKAYSLLLANAILVKQEGFEDESFEAHSWDDIFSRFQAAARQYKGQLGLQKEEWLTLESTLRKEKPEKLPALERAKALFSAT